MNGILREVNQSGYEVVRLGPAPSLTVGHAIGKALAAALRRMRAAAQAVLKRGGGQR